MLELASHCEQNFLGLRRQHLEERDTNDIRRGNHGNQMVTKVQMVTMVTVITRW